MDVQRRWHNRSTQGHQYQPYQNYLTLRFTRISLNNVGLVDSESCSGTQYLIDLLAIHIWLTNRFLCVDNYSP